MSDLIAKARSATAHLRSRTIAAGRAIHVSGGWSMCDVEALLGDIGATPSTKNVIAVGAGGLRSDTRARLSLHQEDYHQAQRPKIVCFWCEEPAASGGRTIVAPVDPARAASIPELRLARVRYFRRSVNSWTPWRPLVECISNQWWLRIALADAHRQVECCDPDGTSRYYDLRTLIGPVDAVEWAAGDALIIDNRLSVHGRERVGHGDRILHRWVWR